MLALKTIMPGHMNMSDTVLVRFQISKYDLNGIIFENIEIRKDGTSRTIYKFLNNNKVESTLYLNGNVISYGLTSYNHAGLFLESIEKSPKNIITMRIISDFDTNGNYKNKVYYSSNGNIWRIENYKYDKRGNLIENTYLFENNKWIMSFYYSYDGKNNLTKSIYKRSDGGSRIRELYYDNNNKLLKSNLTQFYNNDVVWKLVSYFIYDSNNILIKEINNNERGELQYTISYYYEK